MGIRIIKGKEAKNLTREQKWEMLSPFLKQYGSGSMAYSTLQDGMSYFLDEDRGYIAFTDIWHPVFATLGKRISLSDPVSDYSDTEHLISKFSEGYPKPFLTFLSERSSEVARDLGYKVNCMGVEPEIPIQSYNTKGDWKEFHMIRRARNEAKRNKIMIEEVDVDNMNKVSLEELSKKWLNGKSESGREIWLYARRPVFSKEQDVRKFVAFDGEKKLAGFVFYDPMYSKGKVTGYVPNISRCDEERFGKLSVAINMFAAENFKDEGKDIMNLCLSPFESIDSAKFNDDWFTKNFFNFLRRKGDDIYNFGGLSYHKGGYKVSSKPVYLASKTFTPTLEVSLAFKKAGIIPSFFGLGKNLIKALIKKDKISD